MFMVLRHCINHNLHQSCNGPGLPVGRHHRRSGAATVGGPTATRTLGALLGRVGGGPREKTPETPVDFALMFQVDQN